MSNHDESNYFLEVAAEYNLPRSIVDTAWKNAINELYAEYDIDEPLRIWQEDGFERGDLTDEELEELATELVSGDVEELFEFLNGELERRFRHYLRRADRALCDMAFDAMLSPDLNPLLGGMDFDAPMEKE